MIEVELPDGTIAEFPDGTPNAEIERVLQGQFGGAQAPTAMDYVAQAGAGSQEGIAQMLGFPVDAVTSAINATGNMTGMWGPIENPVGGSESIDRLMRPLRRNVPEPRNAGERIARRVGEEVGASAAGAPVLAASKAARAAPVATAITEAASALGAGGGAALANELAPNSPMAEIAGQLLGGVAAGRFAGNRAGLNSRQAQVRSGIDEQKAIADDAYARVRADQTQIPQSQSDDLLSTLQGRMKTERMHPRMTPGAANTLDYIADDVAAGRVRRVEDLEELRRLSTDTMPKTAADRDLRLSQIMKGEITDFIDRVGGEAAEDLQAGRAATRRGKAAEAVQAATDKAIRSAASTGSGGNEINRMRQVLRGILDNPRRAKSFTADELRAMEEIVMGTAGQNAMRRLSRFAPTSGGLSAMLGIGGTLASPQVALPIMAGTEVAKMAGERSTRKAVEALMQSLAPSRVTATSQPGLDKIIQALLAARATASAE